MKKFTCRYKGDGDGLFTNIKAESEEEAVRMFAEQCPSDHRRIEVSTFWGETNALDNPVVIKHERDAEFAARLESLKVLWLEVEECNENLAELSYENLTALVEIMWEFPAIREELDSEARAIGEMLYKKAFFDPNLQQGLQTIILNQIVSGQPTTGAAGPGASNTARNAAMLGGAALALQKLNQIEENTGDVSEGLGFD